MPKLIRPPQEPVSLAHRLTAAVLLAQCAPVIPVHITLGRGLNIWITADVDETIHIQLGRRKSEPSLQEWNTVLKYWPWSINAAPQKEIDGDWTYLNAVIDKQKQINLF